MQESHPPKKLLIINFSSGELNEVSKAQLRRETKMENIVEVHLPCQFNLSKPLPPQIANVMSVADQMAKKAGFSNGLLERCVVVPPGFADAAFIMGAWLAYANVGVTNPIRTVRFSTGWTAMLFESQQLFVSNFEAPRSLR